MAKEITVMAIKCGDLGIFRIYTLANEALARKARRIADKKEAVIAKHGCDDRFGSDLCTSSTNFITQDFLNQKIYPQADARR